jgi:transposase
MRYVAVKTEEQQARAMLFRTRDLLVRQRTQLINALRGHLAEHGVVSPQGPANVKGLAEAIESDMTSLPLLVVELSRRHRHVNGLRSGGGLFDRHADSARPSLSPPSLSA